MTKKLVGLFASVALLGSGMALADDKVKDKDQQAQGSEQLGGEAIGGSGSQQGQMGGSQTQMGGSQAQMGEKSVTGTVLKSSSTLVHVQTDQGVIPLKVGRDTKFEDPTVKRAKDLKEGQQIRADFDIKGTDNVAKSISLDTSMGGSGLDSDTGINQQPGDLGGSGLDQDINKDTGGSGDVGGDMGGDLGGSGDVGGSGDMSGSGHSGDPGHKGDK